MKPNELDFYCTTCGHSWTAQGKEITEEVIKGYNSNWVKYQTNCPNCGMICNTVKKLNPIRKAASLWDLIKKKI